MPATTNDRVLLGTRKGVFEVHKNGKGWQVGERRLEGAVVPYTVRDPRDGNVWASIDFGHWGVKLSRSRDDGKTFKDAEPPKYPEASGATAKYYWVIEPAPADRPGHIWIGTEPGGLFISRDDGATWELNEPLWKLCTEQKWTGGGRPGAGIHSICFDPTDSDHVYVAISCAGVLETKDGGSTWNYVTKGMTKVFDPGDDVDYGHDPHFVTLAPSNPKVLWQANHCGVFKTSNGGQLWDELTDKPWVAFGFAVAVHPKNADIAWLVPMKSDEDRVTIDGQLAVLRTDDGGKTWSKHTEGLPNPAWDFVYRHGMDVSADGESLVMGTTSGNLYASDDGGRTWQTLSSSLPPIYSARFA